MIDFRETELWNGLQSCILATKLSTLQGGREGGRERGRERKGEGERWMVIMLWDLIPCCWDGDGDALV